MLYRVHSYPPPPYESDINEEFFFNFLMKFLHAPFKQILSSGGISWTLIIFSFIHYLYKSGVLLIK
jgi:hypothetical protein